MAAVETKPTEENLENEELEGQDSPEEDNVAAIDPQKKKKKKKKKPKKPGKCLNSVGVLSVSMCF